MDCVWWDHGTYELPDQLALRWAISFSSPTTLEAPSKIIAWMHDSPFLDRKQRYRDTPTADERTTLMSKSLGSNFAFSPPA